MTAHVYGGGGELSDPSPSWPAVTQGARHTVSRPSAEISLWQPERASQTGHHVPGPRDIGVGSRTKRMYILRSAGYTRVTYYTTME